MCYTIKLFLFFLLIYVYILKPFSFYFKLNFILMHYYKYTKELLIIFLRLEFLKFYKLKCKYNLVKF